MRMERDIAQELHIYSEDMLSSRLFYLHASVLDIWGKKEEALSANKVYIGG